MDMWTKTTPYFKRSEFACKCGCGQDVVDAELISILNEVRECFGALVITSGNRCEQHNSNVGGAKRSMHLTGKAADIRPLLSDPNFDIKLDGIHEMLTNRFPDKYGIAIGSNFVHIDTRSGCSRWKY